MIPVLKPEEVGKAVVAGVRATKRLIVIPFMMKLIYVQHALFPGKRYIDHWTEAGWGELSWKSKTFLLRRHLRRRIDRLDARGAIFEFRNLAERIERPISQKIGRRLDKSKRNEDHAVRNGIVLARRQFDNAAAGKDPDRIARLDAELGDGAARHRGDCAWLERVERGGAARH